MLSKHFVDGAERAAVELWKAKVPQGNIIKQLRVLKATLRRILTFANTNPSTWPHHCAEEKEWPSLQVFCFCRRLAKATKKDG
jgi:hypothetical protein